MNLIGEHTDYNSGFVLPIAIDRRTTVAVAPRTDGRIRGWSAQDAEPFEAVVGELRPGRLGGWAAYACGPAWVLRERGVLHTGADLLVDSEVPVGAGLSSSAALQVSLALALSELAGRALGGTELAMAAHRAESDFVGVPVGTMDQTASALGRRSSALFLDTRDGTVEHVPFRPEDAGLQLLVVDTRVKHSLGQGRYAERRRTCEEAAAALGVGSLREVAPASLGAGGLTPLQLRRARHVVTENERVLEAVDALRAGNFRSVGEAFVRSHESLRDDFEVSSPELDVAVEAAISAGALGARMTGGGFGGSAIALVPGDRVERTKHRVEEEFAGAGFARPRIFAVRACGGARREL